MKTIIRNSIHKAERSHDCLIAEIKGKKVKFTYEAFNAVERCTTEFFDGDKWNIILGMWDMGFEPNKSAYITFDVNERKKRADELFSTAETICNGIL